MLQSRRVLWLAAGAFATLATVNATLCGCSKDIALRITNIYENGDTDFHYDYCEDIKDGRGFTAGIAGFCTATGDAWELIQEYHKLTGGNDDFSPMDAVLAKYAASDNESTVGLEDYCKVWANLGKTDTKFQSLQDSLRDKLYFTPSQVLADQVGLKFDVSRGELYDTGLEHGTGDGPDDLGALIKDTSATFTADATGDSGSTLKVNGHSVDEIVWLKKFISVVDDDLKNPKDKENQGGDEWSQDLYRTKSYSYIVDAKTYMYGKSVEVLDNDGNPTTVKCADEHSTSKRRRDTNGRPIRTPRKLVRSTGPPPFRRRRPPLRKRKNQPVNELA
ncbi:hypothetical protein IWW50_002382 [Coemansia erecta]|nr:hypothetical protein GGF43_001855 [Coemansia sp. RSA 2618]KAJ2826383.1 hypothetical protein IWW50_002382 [Coemansia erecta]